MRGASIILGVFASALVGFLVVSGPGGVDARLYRRVASPSIRAATTDAEIATGALEAGAALETEAAQVGAVRGTASDAEGTLEDNAIGTTPPENVDARPEPGAAEAPSGESAEATFPPLEPELQERFRRAWFDNAPSAPATEATEANTAPEVTNEAATAAPGAGPTTEPTTEPTNDAATAGAEGGPEANAELDEATEAAPAPLNGESGTTNVVVEGAEVGVPLDETQATAEEEAAAVGPEASLPAPSIEPYVDYAPTLEELATNPDAWDELVVVPRSALIPRERLGTDPRYDPFVHDALLLEAKEAEGRGTWTGGATTGGAWTGGATTGGATTGGAWTGGSRFGMGNQ